MFSPNKTAIVVDKTENAKLGPMATTYASKSSCPAACPFRKNGGCYGTIGPAASVWKKLHNATPLRVAKDEAAAIRQMSGKSVLRLHTMGDCSTDQAAMVISEAAKDYSAKHSQKVYTYTHAWRSVARKSWGDINVLASCETVADIKKAMKRGYAVALTIPQNHHDSAMAIVKDGIRYVPCPKQTKRAASCLQCGLCLRADKLRESRTVIMLAIHGPTTKAKATLNNL